LPPLRPYQLIFLLNFVVLSVASYAQPAYEQFTINNGLPGNSINSVMQDSKGFIWVASAAGFARYDGHRFKVFRYEINNPNSIKGNFIKYLQQSKDGNIWVCQHAGLSKLNTTNWQVQNFSFADSANGRKYDWEIFQVYEGKEKTLVATSKGLRELDTKTNLLLPYSKYSIADTINAYGTNCITDYDDNTLLIGTWFGLAVMDKKTGLYKRYTHPPLYEDDWETPGHITNIYVDEEKQIWIGWWGGALTRFDLQTKKFESFTPIIEGKKLKWLVCADIKPSHQKNKLYVTDRYQNVYLFDTKKYEWTNITPASVKGTNATYHGVLEDNNHILWLGTSDGLFKADPRKNIFETFIANLPKTPGADNGVATIYHDELNKNNVWLTGYNSGNVYKYDLLQNKIQPLPAVLQPLKNQLWEYFQSYCRDAEGNLWISCSKGIYVFSEKNNTLRLMASGNGNASNIAARHNQVLKTRNNEIYISGYAGLQKYNVKAQVFTTLFTQTNFSKQVTDMCEDANGNIWLAQVEQPGKAAMVTRYNPSADTFTNYNNIVIQNCIYGTGKALRCIYAKDAANIYVGTSFGLFKGGIKNDSLTLQQASSDEGFFAGEIHEMQSESDSIIWIRTSDGVYRHHIYNNSYSRLGVVNGMLNNFPNSIAIGRSKELFLGYQDGNFQRLKTDFFTTITKPQVLITGFKVYGNDFLSGDKDIMQTDNLVISYKQNNIRFEFTALDYTNPEMQLFKYKLEGYDKEWTTTSQPFAVYNNLDGGNYTFKVKASNSYGMWNDEGTAVQLKVKPPFWKTKAFIFSAIILSCLLGYYLYKRRINTIRKEEQLKQQRTEAEMIALRSQMNPHFIFNCLNTIDSFIVTNKTDQASELLQKFSKLIRQVLENSSQPLIPISQECEMLKLYMELEKEVMENKFSFTIDADEKVLHGGYLIPSLLLQPFVENAIHHGLRHNNGMKGLVKVTILEKTGTIEAMVEDNGVGRKKSAEKNQNRMAQKQSMGIQLSQQRLQGIQASQSSIVFTDLEENGEATGTRVLITYTATK
jgi:ligand-binding sensor domain-containing protein